MKQITQTAPTKEEAINVALKKLEVSREDVSITVVEEGKKGFFGFLSKPAVVEVTVLKKENPVDQVLEEKIVEEVIEQPVLDNTSTLEEVKETIEVTEAPNNDQAIAETKQYLETIAKELEIDDLVINETREGKYIYLHLNSEKAALLIGKRGQTLNALENLSQLVANKFSNSFILIRLDVGNYRERRQEALEQLAERMADKAVRTGQPIELEPMSSSERKIIHNALSLRVDIETYSVGNEPNRYLVIESIK
ncbi:RNA-binding cell elongation regulator Jag/EloR [Psychrobacillus sp. BL-248-WT-3]|uniref:RNA-binding cell elongation regulator Jag/EloR n=1 Tax=Psychrobacillus sp. BL-248-WT-3 TaxID=2725306 RepID=UPI00146DC9F4|nr:RNA-binding cell elongation regulator Jag/EloR [Psychrobacillus sp. BL-248-WT-3]NME06108.1 protein jag [Psychrobacillus sp. BL-248-WT-3]